MPKALTLNSDIRELINSRIYLPIFLTIGFFLFISLLIIFGTIGEGLLIFLGFTGGLSLIFLMVRYPKFWIYVILASTAYFFSGRGKNIVMKP